MWIDQPYPAWYEGATLVFTSATGQKIPSLWREKVDV